ncbi:uncharacterized protein LOC136080341 [Hydra vulgaris]|uniref:Uncharacterized protein LOC136080341 n=1 Tax=Hydra vulgaris TaxID=6087 RepID=A0ABM4BV11_HYDVU
MTVSEEFELHNVIHVAHKESEVHKIDKFSGLYDNYSNPTTWVVFDDEMRKLLIEHGPKQVDQFDFPKDSMQRKFSKNHYNHRIANGDKVRRNWLQYSSWKEFELRLQNNKTIDAENLRLVKKEEQYWQQILKWLIALVRVLRMQNLAFRGTHEKLNTADNGNFLKFVEL